MYFIVIFTIIIYLRREDCSIYSIRSVHNLSVCNLFNRCVYLTRNLTRASGTLNRTVDIQLPTQASAAVCGGGGTNPAGIRSHISHLYIPHGLYGGAMD